MIVILSYLYLKEPLPRIKLLGIIVAIVGVFFTVIGADLAQGKRLTFDPADLLLFAACLCWASYTIISRARDGVSAIGRACFWCSAFPRCWRSRC